MASASQAASDGAHVDERMCQELPGGGGRAGVSDEIALHEALDVPPSSWKCLMGLPRLFTSCSRPSTPRNLCSAQQARHARQGHHSMSASALPSVRRPGRMGFFPPVLLQIQAQIKPAYVSHQPAHLPVVPPPGACWPVTRPCWHQRRACLGWPLVVLSRSSALAGLSPLRVPQIGQWARQPKL